VLARLREPARNRLAHGDRGPGGRIDPRRNGAQAAAAQQALDRVNDAANQLSIATAGGTSCAALSALLLHWRILPAIVRAFAWMLHRTMGIGGAVGVSAAANAFVGRVEAPLLVRPWSG